MPSMKLLHTTSGNYPAIFVVLHRGLEKLRTHYVDQLTDLQYHITNLKELLFAVSKE
jgi:hypothetical protein